MRQYHQMPILIFLFTGQGFLRSFGTGYLCIFHEYQPGFFYDAYQIDLIMP